VLLVQQLPVLPSLWWSLLLLPLIGLTVYRPQYIVFSFFVLGVVWTTFRAGIILEDRLPSEIEGQDLVVVGRLSDIPRISDSGQRFTLSAITAKRDGIEVTIPRKIVLFSRNPSFQPRAGETWQLHVRLFRPHGYQNPGGQDYEAMLFREGIRARGYVRQHHEPQRLNSVRDGVSLARWRQDLGDQVRGSLEGDSFAGLLTALVNGDNRGLTAEQWDILRRTGTIHLVAISGLHISLVAGIVFFIFRRVWALPGSTVLRLPAPVFGAFAALAAAAGYSALAGFTVPTQRALIMLSVALTGIIWRRRFPPSQLLAAAGLVVLLYDPLSVLSAGFWLSFVAVAVILFVVQGTHSDKTSLWKLGYLQWAIAIGMLPLMLVLFQQVSLVSPIANLLAIPVFTLLIVPLMLLGALVLLVSPSVASGLFHIASGLLQGLWQFLSWLSDLAFSQWIQPAPVWWAVTAALVGVLLLLAPRGWPARWVGVVWLLPLFWVRLPTPATGEIWFTLLDVGQGLSAVVRTQHHTLLFDAGPRMGVFDTGKSVVDPYLRAIGVHRLDSFVISHKDNDHLGGATSVFQKFPVARTLSSVPSLFPHAEPCRAGQSWIWDEVEFLVLSPEDGGLSRRNDASCVLSIRSRYGRILLPADIEARAEKNLVRRWGRQGLLADILIAPHHGSKTSSTPDFVDTVAARYVFMPVGYHNRYRHPHPTVVQRYLDRGSVVLDSAKSGALEARLQASGIAVMPYRVRHRRYWYAD